MPFKNGLELTELQNMHSPEDDNISNDSNDLIEADNNRISRLLLISVTLLSIYSINLLLKCSQETAMLSYLFIVKNELPNVIKFLLGMEDTSPWYLDGRFLLVVVTVGIILPLCLLKNLGYLGYTSGFSLTCMFFFLVVVIYNKFKIPCPYESINGTLSSPQNATVEEQCTPKYFTFNSKTAYALPTLAFAFVCHPSVLPIYSELRDRTQKKMQLVSQISFFSMFLMYFLTAIFGYLTFYDKVESELLGTYSDKKDVLLLTVRLAVIIAVILTVPVLFFTVRSSLFELARKTKYKFWQHLLVTIILLIIIDLLVIFIPTMKDIFGAIGATSANMLIFILPSMLYLKITNGNDALAKERFWVS
ncbi:hypothetical protein GDO78_021069 [Eleutherodactylus coqui]|uniref:Amino acid transporter transmembrane domain-containing protein n=1 Tax=Eleutherodactylus coqui TaxID=57060 RepID=A0A8J6JT71_ELECQ|nr:hypothetical protein GDO78_021069 [Eleutherodactylus coqui]